MVKVVSLFDGMSCGYMAMLSAGVEVTQYVAYEIDKYAIKASSHNFPTIEHNGDVFTADFTKYQGADFVIGGSPCTYWSIAQSTAKREREPHGNGWDLFQQYVRAVNEIMPRFFIYENNKSMSNEVKDAISNALGVQPVLINSALVSAQFRQRYYWVGCRRGDKYEQVPIPQPADRGVLLKDVLDGLAMADKSHAIIGSIGRTTEREYWQKNQGELTAVPVCLNSKSNEGNQPSVQDRIYSPDGKAPACTQFVVNTAEPIGTTAEGKARTLKAQYSKNGIPNFTAESGTTRGATGCAEPIGAEQSGRKSHAIQAGYAKYSVSNFVKRTSFTSNGTGVCERVGSIEDNGAQSDAIPLNATADGDKSLCLTASYYKNGARNISYGTGTGKAISAKENDTDVYKVEGGYITTKTGRKYPIKLEDGYYRIRKLSVSECKRLQTVPEWFDFSVISNTQAYKCLGNGWTVEVIAHLIKCALNQQLDKSRLDYWI